MKNKRVLCIFWLVAAYFTESISSLSLQMLDESQRYSSRAFKRITDPEVGKSNQKTKRHINPQNESFQPNETPVIQILPRDNTEMSIKKLEAIVSDCRKTPMKSCQGSYRPRTYFTDFDLPYDSPKKVIGENTIDAEEEANEKRERQLTPKLMDQDSAESRLANPLVFVDENLITDIIRDPSIEDIVFIRKEVQDQDLESNDRNRCENAAKQLHILKKLRAMRDDIREKNRRLVDRFPIPDQIPSGSIPGVENRFTDASTEVIAPETTDPSGIKVLPNETGIDATTTAKITSATDDVSTTVTTDITTDLIILDSTVASSTQRPTNVEFIVETTGTETTTSAEGITSSEPTTDPTELTSEVETDITETTGGVRDLDESISTTTTDTMESSVSTVIATERTTETTSDVTESSDSTESSEITSQATELHTDGSTVTEETIESDGSQKKLDGTSTVFTESTITPSDTRDATTLTSETDVTVSDPTSDATDIVSESTFAPTTEGASVTTVTPISTPEIETVITNDLSTETTFEGSTTEGSIFDLKRLQTELSTSDPEEMTTYLSTETSNTESTTSSILDTTTEITTIETQGNSESTESEPSDGDVSDDSERDIEITPERPFIYTTLLPPTANGGVTYHEEISISNHTKLVYEEQVNETIVDGFGPDSETKPAVVESPTISDSGTQVGTIDTPGSDLQQGSIASPVRSGEPQLTHIDQDKRPLFSDDLKAPAVSSDGVDDKIKIPSSSGPVSPKPQKGSGMTSSNQPILTPTKGPTAPGNPASQVGIDGKKMVPLPVGSLKPEDVSKRGSGSISPGTGIKGSKPVEPNKGTMKFPNLPKVDVNTLNKNTPLGDLALYMSQRNNTASAALKDKIDHAFHHAEVNLPMDLGPAKSEKQGGESNKGKITQKELKSKIELAVPNAIVADGLVNTFFIILLSNNATKLNLERWTEDMPAIEVDDLCVPLYENGTIHDFLSITRLLKGTVYFKNSRSKVPIRIKRSAGRKCWSLNRYDILKKSEPVSTLVKRTLPESAVQPTKRADPRNGPGGLQFLSEPAFIREPVQYRNMGGEGVGEGFRTARQQESRGKMVPYPAAQGVQYMDNHVPMGRSYDINVQPGYVNAPNSPNGPGIQYAMRPDPSRRSPQMMGDIEPRGPRLPRRPSTWGEPPPFREGNDADPMERVSELSPAVENALLKQFFRMKHRVNAELDSFIEEPAPLYRIPNFVNKSKS